MEEYDLEKMEFDENGRNIFDSFIWAETPEGAAYWLGVHSTYLSTGKTPEEAQKKFDFMKEQAKKGKKKMTTTATVAKANEDIKKDCVGQELKVGDTIVYLQYGYLRKGTIESFTPKYARIGKGLRAALEKSVKVHLTAKPTPDMEKENKELRDYIAKLSLQMVTKEAA